MRRVVAVGAFGAEDRFVSAFQLGCIRDRRRRFIAEPENLCKGRVDPYYSKALPDELVKFHAGA
jgi:hypothetical protein